MDDSGIGPRLRAWRPAIQIATLQRLPHILCQLVHSHCFAAAQKQCKSTSHYHVLLVLPGTVSWQECQACRVY